MVKKEGIYAATGRNRPGSRAGKTMITISVCMIVKNEEKRLKRCLDSLQGLADEIVIADTGSTEIGRASCRERV